MPIQNEIPRNVVHSTARAWRSRFERYALIGSECLDCQRKYYPQRRVCPNCHTRNMKEAPLARQGTVQALATNFVSKIGYAEGTPSLRAIIELDQGGPSVFSEIVDCDPETVQIGTKVEMVVRRIRREPNGNLQYAHKWVLQC